MDFIYKFLARSNNFFLRSTEINALSFLRYVLFLDHKYKNVFFVGYDFGVQEFSLKFKLLFASIFFLMYVKLFFCFRLKIEVLLKEKKEFTERKKITKRGLTAKQHNSPRKIPMLAIRKKKLQKTR